MKNQTVKELMTPNPCWCTPEDAVDSAARLMVEYDCGAIPVVDDRHARRPLGIITDRDIACRVVAKGWSAVGCRVRDVMTPEPATLRRDTTVHQCAQVMEQLQVRRILIVDEHGGLIGIVAQADLARAGKREASLVQDLIEMVEEVSEPAHTT